MKNVFLGLAIIFCVASLIFSFNVAEKISVKAKQARTEFDGKIYSYENDLDKLKKRQFELQERIKEDMEEYSRLTYAIECLENDDCDNDEECDESYDIYEERNMNI